jgi:hypothetical protein
VPIAVDCAPREPRGGVRRDASVAVGMFLSPSIAARVNRAVVLVATWSIAVGMYPSLPIPLAREQDDGG